MTIRGLTLLSHFVSMLFGVAFGMTLCLLYQYQVKIFIFDLSSIIFLIVVFSILLRIYTLKVWKDLNIEL